MACFVGCLALLWGCDDGPESVEEGCGAECDATARDVEPSTPDTSMPPSDGQAPRSDGPAPELDAASPRDAAAPDGSLTPDAGPGPDGSPRVDGEPIADSGPLIDDALPPQPDAAESTCPADLAAALGQPCPEENAFCGGEGCAAACGFCNLIRCVGGVWERLEVPPPPPDDPRCQPDPLAVCAGGLELPDIAAPAQRFAVLQQLNVDLVGALTAALAQMQAEVAEGGPGSVELAAAARALEDLLPLVRLPVGTICEAGDCISDERSLEMLLDLLALGDLLDAAALAGADVDAWLTCTIAGTLLRAGGVQVRVEFVCGRNAAISMSLAARLALGENGIADAEGRRQSACLIHRTYRDCLQPSSPEENPVLPVPAFCPDDQ